MSVYYEVRATLSQYAGNYARELTAWVFGVECVNLPEEVSLERPHAESMNWAFDSSEDIVGDAGTLITFPHEEYGMVWEDIGDDIDHARKGEFGHDVIWRLSEEPSIEEWRALVTACESFDSRAKVEKVSLTQVEVVRRAISLHKSNL